MAKVKKGSAKMRRSTVALIENVSKTENLHSDFKDAGKRKSYSTQRRLDSPPIELVELNLECRDAIVPVLRALQHLY